MRKLLLIFIVISIVVIGLTTQLLNNESPNAPKAVAGVIDLRQYDLHENTVSLDGEWDFIPDKLLNYSEFDSYHSYLVNVPSLWSRYKLDDQTFTSLGSGTYRLKVLINHTDAILGIKTGNIRMSNAIYINEKRIGQSGEPAENSTYVQQNVPYVAYFSPDKDELEIIIHVANFDYASGGGIIGSVFIGDQESIGKLRESSLFYDLITIAAFFTMFIYFAGSYLYAKLEIEQLYFSLFCFMVGLYSISHGEKVLMELLPITYESLIRVQIISSIGSGIFMLLYFYHALQQIAYKKFVKVLCMIGIVLSATVMLPISISSYLQAVYSIYILINIFYLLYIQTIAIFKRLVGAIYLWISTMAILIYMVVATLNLNINLEIYSLPPLLPFICLTMLSLYISHRFTDSYLEKGRLTNALLRVDKLKDEFLAKTSHEFRTPLHGVIAISQSMLEPPESSTLTMEQKEKISLIFNITEKLSHLVNDIVDFSKLKEGELKLRLANVDLYSVTHVIVEILSYIGNKDVKIYNYIERGKFIVADEDRLRQILYNIIENAVKYTRHGKVEISCYEEQGFLTIEVSDTGRGIAPEHLESIFEPFRQLEDASKGAGLGLNVTKELVNLHGGEITVHSVVDQGTTFCVKLPVEPIKQDQQEKQQQNKIILTKDYLPITFPYFKERTSGKKILIADDDHINLKVLIDILAKENYAIIAVDDSRQVFEQLTLHPDIDLLILDIMMPNLSGYEVCQQIRKNYSSAELPILMLTAAIRPEDLLAAFQSGANDFLHKPLDTAELKTRVRNLILLKESAETAIKMETAFLQAQIKPHFIYNVLNSILSLSYLDLDKARIMITDFATFLRSSLAFENTNSLIPLEQELLLIQAYVNIHQTRYPDQLEWEIQMEEPLRILIPPLLLQPLVENALFHGLKNKRANGKVIMTIKKDQQMIDIQIEDNGNGMTQDLVEKILSEEPSVHQSVGIRNITKRLRKYENTTFHIESIVNKGTTVKLRFPLFLDEKR
ncbi:histidine kinase [Lysinibacillus fusiformis]|uniref:ATP-binding protein n=1 Tax=Lysinibacillus TaxID=400634 RepID=UPI0004FFEE25|nr:MULTISPECIES: ATP-binding protein [Lysinibacillus]KGA81705.1 histidine kinase [Lysinibacillus fusiformis]MCE4046629.1 ATP-binding protein [Lysinibacillus fusiformis]